MKAKWFTILALAATAVGLGSCMDTSDPNAALNAEIKQIDAYLTSLGVLDETLVDGSGIRFLPMSNSTTGAPPRSNTDVKVAYTRRLLSNPDIIESQGMLEDDFEDIKPEGVRYVLSLMMEGASVKAFIPSQYAFGEAGTTGVPANATVIYDLTLLDVVRSTGEVSQLNTDLAAIDKYFEDNQITDTIAHPSGLFYKVTTQGTGDSPTVYEQVSFKYKLSLMKSPTTVIEENTFTNALVFNFIDGFKIGLPLLREGAKVTFYVPSVLAYGDKAQSTTIPANSNLIFEIELIDVP